MRWQVTAAVLLLGILAGRTAATAADDGFVVIVNASNSTLSVSRTQLSKLFLKKTTNWPRGLRVIPVDQKADREIREAFSRAIHGKGTKQIVSYWQRVIFSGLDVPPLELDSDEAVVEFVRHNAGAVGYVAAEATLGNGVKTLKVEE